MPLRVNFSRKNLDTRDPTLLQRRLAAAAGDFPRLNARAGNPLRERAGFVIACAERFSRALVQAKPQIFFVHRPFARAACMPNDAPREPPHYIHCSGTQANLRWTLR